MQPTSTGFKPCQAVITKWSGFYDKVTFEENKGNPLLEDSKATCPIGGSDCISIKNHGQKGEGNQQQLKAGDNVAQNQANPVFKDFRERQTQDKAEEENTKPEVPREIVKVEMTDIDCNPLEKGEKYHYGKTVNVIVHTQGMVGETIHIGLWEDDAKGAGQSDENRYNQCDEQIATIGENGVAEKQFVIKADFAKIAEAHNKSEGSTHEYYFTVFAPELMNTSANFNIYNPDYKEKKVKTTKDAIAGKPPVAKKLPNYKDKAIPKPDKPWTTVLPPHAIVGEQKITHIYFTNDKGDKIQQGNYGTTIRAYIGSKNLIGHQVKMRIYDKEIIGKDHFLGETGIFDIKGNLIHVNIPLSEAMQKKGGNMWYDELYVDIEILETKAHVKSIPIDVKTKDFKVDVPDSLTKGKLGKEDIKDDKKNGCPNCDKAVTVAELKQIFTGADEGTLKIIADTYSKHMKALKMNTCWNKAHFFAQAAVESGKSFSLKQGEGMNYLADDLYLGRWNEKKNKYVTIFSYFKNHKDEAYKYGRIEEIKNHKKIVTQKANEEEIANRVYANRIGNKGIDSGDGWNFRGKGCIQLTGRTNYENANKYTLKYENADIVKNSDLVAKDVKIAVLSSMAYFDMYGVNKKANGCKDVKKKIAPMIGNDVQFANGKTAYEEKQEVFDSYTSKVFLINSCKYGVNDKKDDSEKVTIRLVRNWQTDKSTIGEFTIDNSEIKGYILEEKGPDTTVSGMEQRVPVGTYNLKWHNGTKQKGVLKLYNSEVPESRAILIHVGNTAADTEGCLLAGSSKSKDFVGGSKPKLKEINDYVTEKGIEGAKIIITAKYE
jgi:predicted chitinase